MAGRIIRTPDELHAALAAATSRQESVGVWRDAKKLPEMAEHTSKWQACCDQVIKRSVKNWTT